MVKVLTYGTFDLLHHGHIKLLERAKKLGDYLIVGVTADDFDNTRGKINVQLSLMERIEAVRATGLADEIIVEEYEGQKIDDVLKHEVDIFTVGSDWVGHFDYLKEYCEVVYLERTEGVSSTDIRSTRRELKIGIVGESTVIKKFFDECNHVNGVDISGIYTKYPEELPESMKEIRNISKSYDELLTVVDAVYIVSKPEKHYEQIKKALKKGKHVLCETPLTLRKKQNIELYKLAKDNNLILAEANKTAFSTAYSRLLLMVKTGKIGKVVAIDVTSTSMSDSYYSKNDDSSIMWNSITTWGSPGLLPIFQILGTNYKNKTISSYVIDEEKKYDLFSKIDFIYESAVASIKVGKGVKSEGSLIISGTKGYIYVPAPWWKTDYFEIRYENPADNRRFFYKLDGEGIRYNIVVFLKAVETGKFNYNISEEVSNEISKIMEDYYEFSKVNVLK